MFLGWKSPYGAIAQKTMDDHPPISLHSIFELWISVFISNSEKIWVQNQFSTLIFYTSQRHNLPIFVRGGFTIASESTRFVNSTPLHFKFLNSFYYPRLAFWIFKLDFLIWNSDSVFYWHKLRRICLILSTSKKSNLIFEFVKNRA